MVELLVVIAILAVLMTVSVVGYTSFVDRAKLSKDSVLLEQCNTVLKICAVYKGHNHTMEEALADLSENGIEPADLQAGAKDCDIVWDCNADRFLLMRKGTVLYPSAADAVVLSDCFLTVHSAEEIRSGYSVHLADDFVAPSELCLNNIGIDDGGKAVSFSLSGDTAEALLVHTAGGNATVNLPNGTVHHYGAAAQVTVEAIGAASYHIYGQVERFVLHSGHLVLEAGATVNELHVDGGTVLCKKGAVVSLSAADAAYLENQGGTVHILSAQPSAPSEPGISSDPGIPDGPTAGEPTAPNLFAGGDGSRENPYLISTPSQFSRIADLMAENYSEREETITVPGLKELRLQSADLKLKDGFCRIRTVINDAPCRKPGVHDIGELPEDELRSIRDVLAERDMELDEMCAFGMKYIVPEESVGKVDTLIYYELEETQATETLSQGKQYYYFRLTGAIALPNGYTPIPVFYGELDGAGYTLYAPEEGTGREQSSVLFDEVLGGSVFRNFEFCLSQQPYSLVGGDRHRTNGTLTFEDITIVAREDACVQVRQDGFGALTRYALHSWNAEVIVKNCVNRADFNFHDSASAVFVGERYAELYPGDREIYDNSTVSFISCTNFGSLSGTAAKVWCVGVVSADAGAIDESEPWLKVDEACTAQAQP